jgi:hypothetical protein
MGLAAVGDLDAGRRAAGLLLDQLADCPEVTAMVVAMAGDEPVCSARIEFLPGTSFASLWGGGTVPGWRGQGIYSALVAYRAQLGPPGLPLPVRGRSP